jgi:hypothetical protein
MGSDRNTGRNGRSPLDDMMEVAREMARRNPHATMDELNEALARRVAQYNQTPQRELGGLAPEQVHRLLADEWDGTGVVRLSTDLRLDELSGARTLHNARRMLAHLQREGTVRATDAGNLRRATVATLMDELELEPDYVDFLRRYSKAINEEDVWPLHVVRVLLELAGLVKRRKGEFSLTRRGAEMLADERAGELFALLFRTHFREMNLEYLTRGLPVPGFQNTIAFTLHALGRHARSWRTAAELAPRALPAPIPGRYRSPDPEMVEMTVEHLALWPLEGFGLMARQTTHPENPLLERSRYRVTPLLDRFLTFSL